jgi:hypothetical protein
MHVMDFSGARASAWNVSACGSNKLREYLEPVHLFDHLESAGTAPRRVGDVVRELINAAIDRAQIAELDMRHHYRKLVESAGRMIVQKLQAIGFGHGGTFIRAVQVENFSGSFLVLSLVRSAAIKR